MILPASAFLAMKYGKYGRWYLTTTTPARTQLPVFTFTYGRGSEENIKEDRRGRGNCLMRRSSDTEDHAGQPPTLHVASSTRPAAKKISHPNLHNISPRDEPRRPGARCGKRGLYRGYESSSSQTLDSQG